MVSISCSYHMIYINVWWLNRFATFFFKRIWQWQRPSSLHRANRVIPIPASSRSAHVYPRSQDSLIHSRKSSRNLETIARKLSKFTLLNVFSRFRFQDGPCPKTGTNSIWFRYFLTVYFLEICILINIYFIFRLYAMAFLGRHACYAAVSKRVSFQINLINI